MADAIIDIVGLDDLHVIVNLYNQIYRPHADEEHFQRRYLGRHNIVQMIARIDNRPAGFVIGFELKPKVFFTWFYGVLQPLRRQGVGLQLMEAIHSWAKQNDYESLRCECHNQHRGMLLLALEQDYEIIGIRWDADRGDNLIQLQKTF
jgi:GNAT superfamily N-acetyltransferase